MNKHIFIKKEEYGIVLTFKGIVCKNDLIEEFDNFKNILEKDNNLLFDFIDIEPFCTDSLKKIENYIEENNFKRIAILYKTNAQIIDITKIFKDKKERYISTMLVDNGMDKAIKYLKEGIEP